MILLLQLFDSIYAIAPCMVHANAIRNIGSEKFVEQVVV